MVQHAARTPVTLIFFAMCCIVSLPGIFSEEYYLLFSAEPERNYWWNYFTMVFQHGQVDQPLSILIHLGLNMALLLMVGRWTEILLGANRLILLTLTAWLSFILIQLISGIWINGSSGIIWAYSPFLLIIRNDQRGEFDSVRGMASVLMWVMWLVITMIMTFIPLLFNPAHTLIHTFIFGNLFHLTAVITGFCFYFYWKDTFEPWKST